MSMLRAKKPSVSNHSRSRGSRQQSPVHSRVASAVPRTPYLSGHGGASDLEKFHEAWRIKATVEHPLFTDLFFERTLPVARPLEITQAELNALPNAAARDKLREQASKALVDQRVRLMGESEVLCKKYFNSLSTELQHQVRTRPTFADVWASFNPLELLRLVEATVNNPLGDANESNELVHKAQRAFYSIRQYDTENLTMFFNRFQRVMLHYESVTQVAMHSPVQMKTQIFLDAMNPRCKPYADHVNAEVAEGRNDVFPLSVADAVTKATNWLNRRQQMRELAGHQREFGIEQRLGVVLVGIAHLIAHHVEEIETLDLELLGEHPPIQPRAEQTELRGHDAQRQVPGRTDGRQPRRRLWLFRFQPQRIHVQPEQRAGHEQQRGA